MPDLIVSTDIDTLLSSASNNAARTNLGLGATDTVEFGAILPPAGTTAEIAALFAGSLAVPGALYVDSETGSQWLAVTSSVKKLISGPVDSSGFYFVNSNAGDDNTGLINDPRLPFKTIKAAFDALEADAPSGIISVYIAGNAAYDEVDVMANVTMVGTNVRVFCERTTLFSTPSGGVVFDNTTKHVNFVGIFGYPVTITNYAGVLYAGDAITGVSGGSFFELGSVGCGSTSGMIQLTGGSAKVSAERLQFSGSGKLFLSAVDTTVITDVINAQFTSVSFPPHKLVEVSGTTHCTIINARTKNCAWASLLDATAIVVIQNCAHWRQSLGDSMLAAVPTSNVFFIGNSGSVVALPANITPNLTFGTYTVNAASAQLIPIIQ